MFDFFKDMVKSNQVTEKAAAAEEVRTNTKADTLPGIQPEPATPAYRPGSAVAYRPATPAASRPAARPARPARQESSFYDDWLEEQVGQKLAEEKKEADRLNSAIAENEKQVKLIRDGLTEEEAKDPAIKALLARLADDGKSLQAKRDSNAAPQKKSEEPKAAPKAAPPKDDKSEGDKPKEPPKAAPAPVTIPASKGVWVVRKQALAYQKKKDDGTVVFQILGEDVAYALSEKFGIEEKDIVRYSSSTVDIGATGKPEILPDGRIMYSLQDRIDEYRESQIPRIPDLYDTVESLAEAGMIEKKKVGVMDYYSHVPAVVHAAYYDADGKPTLDYWAISPEIWALGVRKLDKLLDRNHCITEINVVISDGVIVKVTCDDDEDIGDQFS